MIVVKSLPTFVLLRDNGRFTNSYTFRLLPTGMVQIKYVCGMDYKQNFDGPTTIEDARNLWKFLRSKGYQRW